MKCPNCNKEIKENAKFCSYCGYAIKKETLFYDEKSNKKLKNIEQDYTNDLAKEKDIKKSKTAFEELLSNIKIDQIKMFRKNLIGSGNFSNGCFIKYMDFDIDKNDVIKKLFVKKVSKSGIESRQDHGFVFNNDGTMKIINFIQNDSSFRISSLFDDFLFNSNEKKEVWLKSPQKEKRFVVAQNISKFNKRTKINYKTLGDKCQYFVVGKIITNENNEMLEYPLFLFPCIDVDEQKQTIKIDDTGFFNFWVDLNILDNRLSKLFGQKVIMDNKFQSRLTNIQHDLNKNLSPLKQIIIDCTFSAICVITGFSQEYLDPTWNKILKD